MDKYGETIFTDIEKVNSLINTIENQTLRMSIQAFMERIERKSIQTEMAKKAILEEYGSFVASTKEFIDEQTKYLNDIIE